MNMSVLKYLTLSVALSYPLIGCVPSGEGQVDVTDNAPASPDELFGGAMMNGGTTSISGETPLGGDIASNHETSMEDESWLADTPTAPSTVEGTEEDAITAETTDESVTPPGSDGPADEEPTNDEETTIDEEPTNDEPTIDEEPINDEPTIDEPTIDEEPTNDAESTNEDEPLTDEESCIDDEFIDDEVLAVDHEDAFSISFRSDVSNVSGLIAHDGVKASTISHMARFYASLGLSRFDIYTALSTTDAYDFNSGNHLAVGTNVPQENYGGIFEDNAQLEEMGITGPLLIGVTNFNLDYRNPEKLFATSPFSSRRIYEGGQIKIVEQSEADQYRDVVVLEQCTLTLDINYQTRTIQNKVDCVHGPDSDRRFASSWGGTTFRILSNAGDTPELFGSFGIAGTITVTP